MIKRILLALDPDHDTPIATKYAIRLAKRFDAGITGLAVVDISNIHNQIGGGGIGYELYGHSLWQLLTSETQNVAEELLVSFEKEAEKAGVKYTALKKEGASAERIINEMKYHDILVLGRDSHFFYNEPQRDTKTLAQVVKTAQPPLWL